MRLEEVSLRFDMGLEMLIYPRLGRTVLTNGLRTTSLSIEELLAAARRAAEEYHAENLTPSGDLKKQAKSGARP